MLRSTIRCLRRPAALLALVALAGCASGGARGRELSGGSGMAQVLVVNQSNESIYNIYMSPSAQSTWGRDLLGSNVLQRGSSWRLTNITPGRWDIRVVDRSGHYKEFRNRRFESGVSYTLRVDSKNWNTRN